MIANEKQLVVVAILTICGSQLKAQELYTFPLQFDMTTFQTDGWYVGINMSPDNKTMLGYEFRSGPLGVDRPLLWTPDDGAVFGSGFEPNGRSWFIGTTGDNGDLFGWSERSVAVGPGELMVPRATRWEADALNSPIEMQPHPQPLDQLLLSQSNTVSADGKIAVGFAAAAATSCGGGIEPVFASPVVWDSDGKITILQSLPGNPAISEAVDVSNDGSVIVGYSGLEAAVWRENTAPVGLGDLHGFGSGANRVNASGTVVVGGSFIQPPFLPCGVVDTSGSYIEPFVWRTNDQSMTSLGLLPGYPSALPTGVTEDGTTIVGFAYDPAGEIESAGFIYSQDYGLIDLQMFLQLEYGLSLGDLALAPSNISDDGSVIIGIYRDLSDSSFGGFYLSLPSTTGCVADFNGDGILDLGDIGAFVEAYLSGDPVVDTNADGIIDTGDIGAFVQNYLDGTGC